MCAEEVLVLPEVALLLSEPEAKEVDPVDKCQRQSCCLDYEHEKERAKSSMSAKKFGFRYVASRSGSSQRLHLAAAPRQGAKDSPQAHSCITPIAVYRQVQKETTTHIRNESRGWPIK